MADDALWYSMPALAGRIVRLEPLTLEHAPGFLAAAGPPEEAAEIFRWQSAPSGALPAPASLADARAHVGAALAARARGARLPYAVLDARTGEFAGTTSLSDPAPAQRAISIGFTWLGRRWWGGGANAESKLLLMRFAFEALGVVRVQWVTDVRNERSQAALERLGAVREGLLRKHRRRADGSWRDTVVYGLTDDEWPASRERLIARVDNHAGD